MLEAGDFDRRMIGTRVLRNSELRIKEMSQLAPNAVSGFWALANGANKTTYLDAKTREFIALAIPVTTRCDGCIGVHTDRAIKARGDSQRVAEAQLGPDLTDPLPSRG